MSRIERARRICDWIWDLPWGKPRTVIYDTRMESDTITRYYWWGGMYWCDIHVMYWNTFAIWFGRLKLVVHMSREDFDYGVHVRLVWRKD